MSTFTITAAPDTDIWRKPPQIDVFNAPTASPPGTKTPSSGPLSSFRSAQATFSFNWTEQYDQAGLLLSFHPSSPQQHQQKVSTPSSSSSPPRWIKTGVEYYNGNPMLSTVACHRWADWSVAPLTPPPATTNTSSLGSAADGDTWTTIRVERLDGEHDQENGASLWVYQVLPDGNKIPLREICWVYEDADAEPDVWTLQVHAMAARPSKKARDGLEVRFRDVVVEWSA